MVLERVANAILLAIIILGLVALGLSILQVAGNNPVILLIGIMILLAAYLLYKKGA